jgi:chemotaxis methyl-accepting protein methylase
VNDLAAMATAVAEQSGIRLPRDRLAEAIERLYEDARESEDSEISGELLVGRLIDALTVKESYFLRQPEQLRALDWPQLLAQAIADRRSRVRVWSAACAQGEEPYTLALLASEEFGEQPPPVDVLGTDIADSALERAAAGRYGTRAVRHLTREARERFFEPRESGLEVSSRLRELVRFKSHNLARDPMPPPGEEPFDLIVCRNVLIYFEPFAIEHLTRSLPGALAAGAKLVLGAADRLCLTQRSLRDLGGRLGEVATRRPFRREARRRRRPSRPAPTRPAPAKRPRRPSRDVTDPALAGALRLADRGKLDEASQVAGAVVEGDPMSAPAHFVCGTVELARGDAAKAVRSLRAALYADPAFAAAAFQLGRAHDTLGQGQPARRAYRVALERLEAGPSPYPWLLEDVDAADLAVACAVRLRRGGSTSSGTTQR